MLTKDLIICRVSGRKATPLYLDTASPEYLQLADNMLAAFRAENHPSRGEIEEKIEPLLDAASNRTIAKGIQKIVEDLAVFRVAEDQDYPSQRRTLFETAAKLIQSGKYLEEQSFQDELRRLTGDSSLLQNNDLYGDLPENDILRDMRVVNARQILERYNLAQVQGLLMFANTLQIDVNDDSPARLRRLMKYAKFFRLIVQFTRIKGGTGLHLDVSGPSSILEHSKRYGIQLAVFFPAVCTLKYWKLTANLFWKLKPTTLTLDEKSGLVTSYHSFAAVIPEEITLFERHFREKNTDWSILDDTPFIEGDNGEVFFPDFTFKNAQGDAISLELFHRWHSRQLLDRLSFCEKSPDLKLVIGVDKSLADTPEIASRLQASTWFQQHGYTFRDYPTVDKTLRALKSWRG